MTMINEYLGWIYQNIISSKIELHVVRLGTGLMLQMYFLLQITNM